MTNARDTSNNQINMSVDVLTVSNKHNWIERGKTQLSVKEGKNF